MNIVEGAIDYVRNKALEIKKDARMLIKIPGSQRNTVFITDFFFNLPPIATLP